MIGIDTDILLRWLIDDSIADDDAPHQTALVDQAINGSKEVCFANIIVVAETLWVVGRAMKQSKAVQAEIVDRLLNAYNVQVSDRAAVENALESFRDGAAGIVDCLIGEMNALAGCSTTLTFDKAAAKTKHFTALS